MIRCEEIKIDARKIKDAYWTLKVLTMPMPKRILEILQYHYPEGRTVTQLHIALRVEQSVASQYLAWLRKYQFVTSVRDGKNIIYTINHDRLSQISQALDRFHGRDKGIGVYWETTVA